MKHRYIAFIFLLLSLFHIDFAQALKDSTYLKLYTLTIRDDSCGNPIDENSMWQTIVGKVVKVIDGDDIEIVMDDGQNVAVHLAGLITPDFDKPFGFEAKQYLENAVSGKRVNVIASMSWKPITKSLIAMVSGIVRIEDKNIDINYSLIRVGLAKYAIPESYSMSDYIRCQYERASSIAHLQKVGLWKVAP